MEVEEATPEELLKYAEKNPHTITVNTEDAGEGLVCYNVAPKKDKDDIVYKNPYNKMNLRRGLTYIEQLVDFKRQKLQVARKGLRKFFDLYRQYLEDEETPSANRYAKQRGAFLDSLKGYKLGFRVHYIEKANGENAQISFSNGLWVICSKNRVMFVKEEKDLDRKDRSRFVLTTEIARRWFGYYNKLTPEQQAQLKHELEGLTLIGEYCDSVRHQHIIKYNDIVIRFYAVVAKRSSEQCLTPNQSYELFKKYGLDTCTKETVEYNDTEHMMLEMKEKVRLINKRPMEEYGEGCVVYIEAKLPDESSRVLSIWKIKTVEYRILRKLREKLLVFLKNDRKNNKLFKKYVEEIKELASVYQPHRQLDYYIELSRKAFELTEGGDAPVLRYVATRYLDFLAYLNKKGASRQELLKIAEGEKLPELNESDQQEAAEDKQQKTNDKEKEPEVVKPNPTKKQIIVVVPLTIPCSGKTFSFKKLCEVEKDIRIEVLSSDSVREEIMNELRKKNKKWSQDELFDKSSKPARKMFYDRLNRILTDLERSPEERCLFVLDKNHPTNNLDATVSQIRHVIGKNCRIVALLPECRTRVELKGKFSYPFSKEFILTCMARVLKREEHETLVGDNLKKANIVLAFANMFRNYRFTDFTLAKHFDGVLPMRLTNEETAVPPELEQLLIDSLLSMKPGSFDPSRNLEALVESIKDKIAVVQLPAAEIAEENCKKLHELFERYETMKIQPKKEEVSETKQ